MFTWGMPGKKLFGFPGCQNTKVAAKYSLGGAKCGKHSTIQETPKKLISQTFRKSVEKRKCTLKYDFSGHISR